MPLRRRLPHGATGLAQLWWTKGLRRVLCGDHGYRGPLPEARRAGGNREGVQSPLGNDELLRDARRSAGEPAGTHLPAVTSPWHRVCVFESVLSPARIHATGQALQLSIL